MKTIKFVLRSHPLLAREIRASMRLEGFKKKTDFLRFLFKFYKQHRDLTQNKTVEVLNRIDLLMKKTNHRRPFFYD